MTTKLLSVSFALCLTAASLTWCQAQTAAPANNAANGARAAAPAQAGVPLSVAYEKGAPQIKTPAGSALSGMKLRLRFSSGTSVAGEFVPAGTDRGSDSVGSFERQRYRLNLNTPSQPAPPEGTSAVLEPRHYRQPDTVVAALDYTGPALAPTDGVLLIMGVDNFARGMALKQLKLYWLSPVFISDHRLLSPANQLLLWKQMNGDNYHLMVPLAGGGMIGTLGVSEIEYRYEFRVSASSQDPNFAPRRIPLFAFASSGDPYQLPRGLYETAFAASEQYGRLRWEKSFPEIFRWLGWCSWNTYYKEVTEEKVINSVRSLRDRQIPVGFILVDDGWLNIKDNKLADFAADPKKFPRGMDGLAKTLREEYRIPHVGVWHTFQGYWDGVDKTSPIGQAHKLFTGIGGKSLPDPRDRAGQEFYAAWYAQLKRWGYDFVKVDNQGSNGKFTNGFMPLFASGGGSQRHLQEAASAHFSDAAKGGDGKSAGLNVINCMEMSLEGAFNWRLSNIARNSDDYSPDSTQNSKEHVFQNAYNAYWTSNFAYPDWDMFQSHDPYAEFHAIARAISGGPVYFTDEPGKESPEILRRLALSDGRLLLLDEPGLVTRDLLLRDVSLEALPLKVFGRITRPGMSAGMVAAFNVNKSAPQVAGTLNLSDVEALGAAARGAAPQTVAVYGRGNGQVTLLAGANATLPLSLGAGGYDLFTLAPVEGGAAIFGLLDKYIGPAAVTSVTRRGDQMTVNLREAGDFGAWLAGRPAKVSVGGREFPPSGYSYEGGLLRIPRASFGDRAGAASIVLTLSPGRR